MTDNSEYSSEGGLRVRVQRGQITLSHNGRTLGDEITIEPNIASLAEICAPQANALQPVDDLTIAESCSDDNADHVQAHALDQPINDPNATDPLTIRQAQQSQYWNYWLAAIYEELEALGAKGVYDEVEFIPLGRKAVDCKWVLHIHLC